MGWTQLGWQKLVALKWARMGGWSAAWLLEEQPVYDPFTTQEWVKDEPSQVTWDRSEMCSQESSGVLPPEVGNGSGWESPSVEAQPVSNLLLEC